MRLATLIFLLILSFALLSLTYNLFTMIIHYRDSGPSKQASKEKHSRFQIDPVIANPKHATTTKNQGLKFHIALTATNTSYSKWQSRIMYYWYKKNKDLPGSDMGSFTRILHSGSPDDLMDEIPSFVVDPLPDGYDLGYVVLNRPWAFVQWLEKTTIEEEFILMAEPDHIFLKPLPNLGYEEYPAAYPFFYITPKVHAKVIRKFFPEEMGPVTNIDPIGNSPVIIKKDLLEKIAPTWMNVSIRMKVDTETDEAFGWVLEMYAYAVASAIHGVQHILWKHFMLQPPWDLETANNYILHFTYSCNYSLKGKLTYGKTGEWHFDKREYLDKPPPRNLSLPPTGVPESVVTLIKMINEATANLPNWDTTL
ncbi:Hydroxyproline O-arabinosyltransferase rdn2 [Castilleja foliolosa]|uniref:Hydroxyproline O-arabinosyltransferase rdn2 n=1 Tax=Castilleja foliolosa TaxID=1961234 RepID=A0ABD3BZY4_9LAMI